MCILNTLGFYCVTITYSGDEYFTCFGFHAVKIENDAWAYIALMMFKK